MKNNCFTVVVLLLCLGAATIDAQTRVPTPTPAPAPAPDYVNLTDLLSVAGPFHTFLDYLQTTKVLDTFQNQANNTDEGITIFVPRDSSFSSSKKQLSNLTQDHLKSLCLFHALPHYYSLSDFRNLSHNNPVPTFASSGPLYSLNFTDRSGTILMDSGWTQTKVISAVHASDPVALYEVDKVLLPEAIFGTDIPPTPAPVPAPEIAPAADNTSADHRRGGSGSADSDSSPTSAPSSSRRISDLGVLTHHLILCAVVGAGLLFF